MKQIKLTQNQITIVDDEDYEYLNQWKWYAIYSKSANTFYATRVYWISNKSIRIYMHRLIMGINDSKIFVDHKNHDGLNNCKSNLRFSTRSQNSSNTKSHKNSSSHFLGVSWDKKVNKWAAMIGKNGKVFRIGVFNDERDAARAYNLKAIEMHGEFANLNKITA